MTVTYAESSSVRNAGHLGYLGVEAFFVISGFVIPYSLFKGRYEVSRHWPRFMGKRLVRLEPPYIAAIILALGLWYVSALMPFFQGEPPDVSAARFFLHFGYLNDLFGLPWLNPVFWTLAIEFQFYLAVSLVFPLLVSPSAATRWVTLCVILSLAFLLPSKVFVFKYLCLFGIGIVAFQYYVGISTRREFLFAFALTSYLLFLSKGLLTALVGIPTALIILFVPFRRFRILAALGAISYSLYLVHVPVGGRVINLGRRVAESELELLLLSLTGLAVSVIAAFVFTGTSKSPHRTGQAD